jgi:peptidoglycan/LPS O-acetylase OafA/YrhL
VNTKFKLGYQPALDGLRGVAILGVMIYHANVPYRPYLSGGFIGVDIFFVLSGFLITSLLIEEFDSTGRIQLKNFYARRALRLLPALIVLLIVFCIASLALLPSDRARSNLIDAAIALFYVSNWARAFAIHPPDYIGHTWSLAIEEQFYILWPLLLLTLLRITRNRKFIAHVACGIAITAQIWRIFLSVNGASIERIYNGLDTRADALMIGCTLGIALASGLIQPQKINALKWLTPLTLIALGAFAWLSHWNDFAMAYYGFIVVAVLAAILVLDLMTASSVWLKNLLSQRWLVWIGSISYGVYLWHYVVDRVMSEMGFRGATVLTFGTLITFAIASASYYAIEKPILRLKKRFSRSSDSNPHKM